MTPMDRREFLGVAASAGVGLGLPEIMAKPDKPKAFVPGIQKRKYWVWTEANTGTTSTALKAKYKKLKSHGLDGVFLGGGPNDREYEIVKAAGLELHAWMWTTNRGDDWI